MIADRVRHVRAYYGWSQETWAALIGRTQPAISQIEKGGGATDETIAALARTSGFSEEFFRRGPLPDLPDGSLRFRKRSSSKVRDDARVRAHVRNALEVVERVSRIATPAPTRLQAVSGLDDVDSGFIEACALDAREWLGVGPDDPIPNVVRAVERAGALVIGSVSEIAKHDGASFWPGFPLDLPVVCVTRGLPGDRERMTIAHEVGHLVLHTRRSTTVERAETEAFRFASALLMPAQAAKEEIQGPITLQSLARTKARWGVSVGALIRRSLDLGLIDDERRLSLEKQLSARGWRRSEPVDVPNEQPLLLRRLLEAGYSTADPRTVAPTLGIPAIAVRDLLS